MSSWHGAYGHIAKTLPNKHKTGKEIRFFISYCFVSVIYLFIYLFINSIPKSIDRSSSNGYRNIQSIRIINLALCNRQPVTKIGSLE